MFAVIEFSEKNDTGLAVVPKNGYVLRKIYLCGHLLLEPPAPV